MSIQPDEPIALADMMLRRASQRDKAVASAFLAVFVAFTFAASRSGVVQGPIFPAFIPIAATLWGMAALLTAYLVFTQLSVNGLRAFTWLGIAYAATGLYTIPYIVFFPGIFFAASSAPGREQISFWLWAVWHITFPLVIAGYRVYDRDFSKRVRSGHSIRRRIRIAVAAVVCGVLITSGVVIINAAALPQLVVGGRLTALWSHVLAPLVFAINAGAAILIIGAGRKLSLLQMWLGIALATSALDGALNAFAGARYSFSWYLGKIETLTTASLVLFILLSQVGALYRRLGNLAIVDALTGLRNRRSFDEYAQWTLSRRAKSEIAFLLLDIDFFKQYNDRYGHAAGDVCLRRVADVLRFALLRPADFVARFGGEEFVVLLPDTTAAGARDVAERIRLRVEALAIVHAGSKVGPVVTLSIGVAHALRSAGLDGDRLFAVADRALYEAKVRRNTTVVADSIGEPLAAVPKLELRTPA